MKLRSLLRIIRNGNVLNSKVGWCPVCQRHTVFLPTDSIDTIRNHALCLWCKSAARNRHLALWVSREMHQLGINGPKDIRSHPEIKVFNTSSMSATARALGRASNIICSEYFDGMEPGALKDGVMNQDLRRLTFQDNSLDLIITEDVFEHVPEYREGFREVHRVLKRGGWHIFSIPYYFDVKTRDLFDMKEGKLILQEPIEYHGDPVRGDIPCFAHFGYDLLEFHRSIGFDIRIEWARYSEICKFGVFDCYTLIARKR